MTLAHGETELIRGRRNRMEIIYEILMLSSGDGATKTALVYRANSNFTRIKEQVDTLVLNELVEKVERRGQHVYLTTAKGKEVLQHLSAALEATSPKIRTA